jgi:hypothetical protein
VLGRTQTSKEVECWECRGKGRILRMLACCAEGCHACKGDKYFVNPVWQKYRKQPVPNPTPFQCPICLIDVELAAQKYVMSCTH